MAIYMFCGVHYWYMKKISLTLILWILLLFTSFTSIAFADVTTEGASAEDAIAVSMEAHSIAVSNSLVGPWTATGSVDISKMVFVEFRGLDNSKFNYPKRCLKFQSTTKCSKTSDFVPFYWGEWVNASTTRVALKRGKVLEGTYEVYLLYKDGQPEKVGTFTTWTSEPSPVKVFISNSASGPWELNGSAFNTGNIYAKITGLKKSKHPKVCTVSAGSMKCHTDTEIYRSFNSEEWIDATTTQIVMNGGGLSDGLKDMYIRYLPNKSDRARVGSFTLKAAVASADSGEVQGLATQCVDLWVNMHRGYESYSVTKLQEFLRSHNFLGEVTGFYGDLTIAAIKEYQGSKGLPKTGMTYELTRAAIKAETCGY
jgi:hypothetical protein